MMCICTHVEGAGRVLSAEKLRKRVDKRKERKRGLASYRENKLVMEKMSKWIILIATPRALVWDLTLPNVVLKGGLVLTQPNVVLKYAVG